MIDTLSCGPHEVEGLLPWDQTAKLTSNLSKQHHVCEGTAGADRRKPADGIVTRSVPVPAIRRGGDAGWARLGNQGTGFGAASVRSRTGLQSAPRPDCARAGAEPAQRYRQILRRTGPVGSHPDRVTQGRLCPGLLQGGRGGGRVEAGRGRLARSALNSIFSLKDEP